MKELYRQATEIFLEVCDLEPKQKLARLNVLCQDNLALRTRVEQMLRQDQTSRLASNAQLDLQAIPGLFEPEDSSNSAPNPPDIQGYQIVQFLGRGGMGIVWQALQTSTRREVALKVLPADTTTNQKAHRRFEREIELAARLDHPNIARIFESGICKNTRYYAMEYIDGSDLATFSAHSKLNQRQIVELMVQVCNAIQHAHQRGVIHRDIKPTNILIRKKDGRPFVVDFGLAKPILEEADAVTAMTVHGQLLGTVAYMSPEQASGLADELDTRTDVYSLGVVLYRLLTGQMPHDLSGSSLIALRRIAEEDVRRPRQMMPLLESDLEAILLKALDRDRERRYETGGELSADLRRYLRYEPVHARAITSFERTKRWCIRNPVVAMLLAALLFVFTVGLTTTSWKWLEASRHLHDLTIADEKLRGERNVAIEARKEAERNVYYSDIAQANLHLKANNLRQARISLDQHIPDSEETDFRDWEWYFLDSLAQDSAKVLPVVETENQWVLSLAFSPNGNTLAVGTGPPCFTGVSTQQAGSLQLWNFATEECELRLKTRDVKQVIYSDDGRHVATLELQHDQLREIVDAIRVRNAHDGTLEATIVDPIRWWINQKDGSFSPGAVLKRLSCSDVVCVDIDADGDVDVIASDSLQSADLLFKNIGRGSFAESQLPVSTDKAKLFDNSVRFTTGDINGDGISDVLSATADSKTRVYLGAESNEFHSTNRLCPEDGIEQKTARLALGDLDGDGDLDLFRAANNGANEILLNDGSGNWKSTRQELGSNYTHDVVLADFDSDGDLDAYCANYHRANQIWLNDGSGRFHAGERLVARRNSNFLTAGDIDGDRDVDVIEGFGPCLLWRNKGDASFDSERFPKEVLSDRLPSTLRILLGDIDNDEDLDAVLVGGNSRNSIWLNDGHGQFKRTSEFGNHFCSVAFLSDINDDGYVDILVGYSGKKHEKIIGFDANGMITTVDSEPLRAGNDAMDYRTVEYSATTGEKVNEIASISKAERSGKFSPCGRYQIVWEKNDHNRKSGVGEEILTLKSLKDNRSEIRLAGHEGPILAAEFSPDGEIIATAGGDATVRLWRTYSGAPIATYLGHSDRVIALAFHPEKTILASGGWDGSVRIWDANPNLGRFFVSGNSMGDATFADIAYAGTGGEVLALTSRGQLLKWIGNSVDCSIRDIAARLGRFDRDGQRLAFIPKQNPKQIKIADVGTGNTVASIDLDSAIAEFDISADGKSIVTALRHPAQARAMQIQIWNADDGKLLGNVPISYEKISHLSFAGKGDQLVIQSLGAQPKLTLFNIRTQDTTEFANAPEAEVVSLATSDDANLVAAQDLSGQLKVWNSATSQLIWATSVKGKNDLTFNPVGSRLASCNVDETLIWDSKTGRQLLSLRDTPRLHSPPFNPCVTFGPSGKTLAATQWNRQIKLWRIDDPD